jgi:hypothetical protein
MSANPKIIPIMEAEMSPCWLWDSHRRKWSHAQGIIAGVWPDGKATNEAYLKSGYTHYHPEQLEPPTDAPEEFNHSVQ